MMKIKKMGRLLCAAVLMAGAMGAQAEMSPAEVARLGKDLTPMGAETAGNADGSIPAWEGGLAKPPAGWSPEKGYTDPYASEKPLMTITAQNVGTYKDKLSAGTVGMLEKYPDFKVVVYPTHRSFANPQEIYDATKAQAGAASVDGISLKNYKQPGTPFPVPKSGVEAMYNHLLRWWGGVNMCEDWLPVRSNGDYYRVGFCEENIQAPNLDNPPPNVLFYFFGYYDAPATLKGTIYLVRDAIDKTQGEQRLAWIYNAGQRRIRRAPDLAYDNIDDGTEGMRTTDDYWSFNGALDRYDWKLVGKKEMYIPYNAYKLSDSTLKYKDMVGKGSLKADLLRFELHRVYVVEATLKPGMSHVYSKRVMYLDEDSHIIALQDCYDSKGNLWRVHINPLMQLYDVPRMFHRALMVHDLSNGNYYLAGLDNERKQPALVHGIKGKVADFEEGAIRRRGVR